MVSSGPEVCRDHLFRQKYAFLPHIIVITIWTESIHFAYSCSRPRCPYLHVLLDDKDAIDGSRSSKRKRDDGSQEEREITRSQASLELESDNRSLREENVLFREENKVLREENVKFRADNLSLRKKIDELKGDNDYGMDLNISTFE